MAGFGCNNAALGLSLLPEVRHHVWAVWARAVELFPPQSSLYSRLDVI